MKVLVLTGLLTLATAPFASAAETDAECQLDENRRAPQLRIDSDTANGGAPPTARQTSAPRDSRQQPRVGEETARTTAEGRRSGKRIPDAELIGPRGAL